jgi:hypothetical protein
MKKIFNKIISGGQTGVDRAALDAALELNLPAGVWCPKGWRAEDGSIPIHYPLQETGFSRYPFRTEKNILDSDGTLILTWGQPKGGTALTIKLAKVHHKPFLIIDLSTVKDIQPVRDWANTYRLKILNVAGPRESEAPGIHNKAFGYLKKYFGPSDSPIYFTASMLVKTSRRRDFPL